jgi:SynChlorMet cassette protein ScmD
MDHVHNSVNDTVEGRIHTWRSDLSQIQKPIANSFLVLREEFDDWAILFDPDTGTAFGLNPVAVLIWKHLDGSRTEEDLVHIIEEQFENIPQDVREHVCEFLAELVQKGYAGFEV